MDRTHYRIFPERTGDPTFDNRARLANRMMSRQVRESFRVIAWGRRRKKKLTRDALTQMFNLYLKVMAELANKDA